ncbi:MAG: sodium-translocating pyrophosphatase [Candidatus Nealsonbacteria bacterium CG23_combo_of_CG06-09_8_20_14_all_36_12]|uniref:K(+)-insensitive pyrophosphate-energized proton pump n=2 Tax=Candidatus Nealsoniibacteriota TaxID=1817911 RepID=A0A2H0TLB1_9BACT|nr:MAG: sodium-translocating pyrophosphatase [Candidatus Nealsonbacteria bacterium CG23_combo_of_CG06-09_8_20_14_all_36_12]PIR72945.1 MAG: sodium-translocating pyrophosphatase [Candidatus Nealsonbacteria bacterium CG10_big_fil_rev_8_21_14_0_10_36_23]
MLYIPITISLFTLVFTFFLIQKIKKSPPGIGEAVKISQAIREGAVSYLKRQYKTISLTALVIFFLLWLALGFKIALGFLIGAVVSAISGFIGMMVSTQANLRVAEAAKKGLREAFSLSFQGGTVTGFLVASLGLLSISLFYLLTQDLKGLVALGFGGSLISVFARLGGGIYTKAADIGADLVGKIEKGIPEDDPRNPAVIADLVGDNVGDCAGMAADLFETYVVTLVAGMLLGGLIFPFFQEAVLLPLILGSVAILASILATFFVRLRKENPKGDYNPPTTSEVPFRREVGGSESHSLRERAPQVPFGEGIIGALYKGLAAAALISAIGFYPVIRELGKNLTNNPNSLYLSAIIGLLVAAGIFLITEYFTSKKYRPVQSIVKASVTGHATNIITGLAVGMKSTILPIILICLGILISFWLAGLYGLAITTVAMLSLVGIIIALDSYGPITDNASGIVEMSSQGEEVRRVTDALDAVGNTTKAVTKGYAIASAGLAALVLFSVFTQEILDLGGKVQFLLEDPKILIGLFIGGLLPYFFASLVMEAVGKTGAKVVEEVRRQFREIKGIMEGEVLPKYGLCVDIVTKAAIREMMVPALIPVVTPILVGFILGPEALGGLLVGSIVTGLFIAISMTSGGAAWDNAKKYIEEGNLGGKGSFAHQAAVTGDTVGDPCKDSAGPAINPMIKVLNIVALLIVGFLI